MFVASAALGRITSVTSGVRAVEEVPGTTVPAGAVPAAETVPGETVRNQDTRPGQARLLSRRKPEDTTQTIG